MLFHERGAGGRGGEEIGFFTPNMNSIHVNRVRSHAHALTAAAHLFHFEFVSEYISKIQKDISIHSHRSFEDNHLLYTVHSQFYRHRFAIVVVVVFCVK